MYDVISGAKIEAGMTILFLPSGMTVQNFLAYVRLNGKVPRAVKPIEVKHIEHGKSCKGIHVNVIRPPRFLKRKGKWVTNPEGDQVLSHDGCFDYAMPVLRIA